MARRRDRGQNPERTESDVHCGWYRLKMRKGAPWVPARIYLWRDICKETGELLTDEQYRLDINGIEQDPLEFWTYLNPISHAEYNALIDLQRSVPAMMATTTKLDLAEEPILP